MKENLCSYTEGLDFFQFDFKLEDFLTFALHLRHKARATAGNWSVPHKSMCLSSWFLAGGITLEGHRVFGFLRPGWWTQVTSRAGVGCLEGCSSVLFLSFSVWYGGRIIWSSLLPLWTETLQLPGLPGWGDCYPQNWEPLSCFCQAFGHGDEKNY